MRLRRRVRYEVVNNRVSAGMKDPRYTISDLQTVSAVESLTRRPEFSFVPNKSVGEQLSERLLNDADHFGEGAFCVEGDQWWLVWSETDWMRGSKSEIELFTQLVPVRGAGLFRDRAEVYLTAFADDVVTWSARDGWFLVKGTMLKLTVPARAQRLVVFTCATTVPRRGGNGGA